MSEYKRLREVKTCSLSVLRIGKRPTTTGSLLPRSGRVCIELDREKLLAAFDRTGGVTHRYVTYELVSNANSKHDVDLEILPFTKRWPYGDEREYRAVFVSADEDLKAFPGTIELASISPWLAPGLVDAVKETLDRFRSAMA